MICFHYSFSAGEWKYCVRRSLTCDLSPNGLEKDSNERKIPLFQVGLQEIMDYDMNQQGKLTQGGCSYLEMTSELLRFALRRSTWG